MVERRPFAVYAITRHGLGIAARLAGTLGDADVYVSEKLLGAANAIPELSRALTLKLPMGPVLSETFTAYDCHVFAISVGAWVSMLAPLFKCKKIAPPVSRV